MMAYRYLGGADFFEWDGKHYVPGDSVPIDKKSAEHHVRYSIHRFEGLDAADLEPAEPVRVAQQPKDDRGAPVDTASAVRAAERSAQPAVAAGQPAAAKKD
jgi:hypothetical protein